MRQERYDVSVNLKKIRKQRIILSKYVRRIIGKKLE